MTRLPREPLDADERALAARLPRLHGREEPDAGLDARILAAAHAAVSSQAPVAQRRRGWIVPLTAAASVSLAVGLAWQLQPPPGPPASTAHGPVASAVPGSNGEQAVMRSTDAVPPPADAVQSLPSPMVAPAREAAPAEDSARIARERTAAEPRAEAPAATPVFVPSPPPEAATADAMADAVMAPPPAPPAPPAPATPAARSPAAAPGRSAPVEGAVGAAGNMVKPQAKQARAQDEAEAAAAATTLDTVTEVVDEEDVPPATMDAPAARDAWLRRIGELQQQGRIDEAKASLAEFRRRYPDAVLPQELRKLEP